MGSGKCNDREEAHRRKQRCAPQPRSYGNQPRHQSDTVVRTSWPQAMCPSGHRHTLGEFLEPVLEPVVSAAERRTLES